MDPLLFSLLMIGGAGLTVILGGWVVSKLGW